MTSFLGEVIVCAFYVILESSMCSAEPVLHFCRDLICILFFTFVHEELVISMLLLGY